MSLTLCQFYNATDKWYKTWPEDPKERGLAIKNFKMVRCLGLLEAFGLALTALADRSSTLQWQKC